MAQEIFVNFRFVELAARLQNSNWEQGCKTPQAPQD